MPLTIENCEFVFRCPRCWQGLQEQVDPTVRFCPECQRNVHHARTDDELREHVAAGRCVALQRVEEPEFNWVLGEVIEPLQVSALGTDRPGEA